MSMPRPWYSPEISLGNLISLVTLAAGGVGVAIFLHVGLAKAEANDVSMEKRIDRAEQRIDAVEARLDRQLEAIDAKLDKLIILSRTDK